MESKHEKLEELSALQRDSHARSDWLLDHTADGKSETDMKVHLST
jgi:hypothetical protein